MSQPRPCTGRQIDKYYPDRKSDKLIASAFKPGRQFGLRRGYR